MTRPSDQSQTTGKPSWRSRAGRLRKVVQGADAPAPVTATPASATFAESIPLMRAMFDAYAAALPVRRVVVVGNAPQLPDAERAHLIDTADVVVRCNSFVLDRPGDEPCLGTRVTAIVLARATRPTPFVFDDYTSRAYFVVDIGNVRAKNPPPPRPSWPSDLGAWPIPNETIGWPLKALVSPETQGRGVVPTTGTLATYLALVMYPDIEVQVCGFSLMDVTDPQGPPRTTWEHHYGTTVPIHAAHKIDREGRLFGTWLQSGRLSVLA